MRKNEVIFHLYLVNVKDRLSKVSSERRDLIFLNWLDVNNYDLLSMKKVVQYIMEKRNGIDVSPFIEYLEETQFRYGRTWLLFAAYKRFIHRDEYSLFRFYLSGYIDKPRKGFVDKVKDLFKN